jgi:hypothetical protein
MKKGSRLDLLCFEKAIIRAAWADCDMYPLPASGTAAGIGGLIPVDVGAGIDIATLVMNAQEFLRFRHLDLMVQI